MHLIKLEKDKSILPPTTITYFLNPDYVYIPVKNIIVKENDLVYKRQMVSENIYSPVSGKVLGIKKCNVLNKKQNTLVIENDFREMNKEKDKKKIKLNIPNLLKLIEENPRLFNKFKSSKTFDTIIVSNINDNPYVYNKIFLLKENIDDILELIESLSIIYKSDNNLLIIKNNEAFIIDECLKVIGTYPKIKLTLVNDEYLLENERYLAEKLSLKNNCLYLTVEDILEINDLLKTNISTTMIITVSGNAIKENKVFRLKENTLLSVLVSKYIEIKENDYEVIINGLMTGFKLNVVDDFVITKDIKSINIMKKTNVISNKCINCGKCIEICPENVNPLTLKNKKKCLDCGLCSYICPARICFRNRLKGR